MTRRASALRRLLLYALGGLLLGGIIHIVVILLVPDFATRDAWTALGRFGPDGAFHLLPRSEPGTAALPDLDPAMAHAACRFTLAKAPIRIRARLPDEFWSLAVFDRRGSNVYSLNDRTAERRDIDLVIATPLQMLALRETPTRPSTTPSSSNCRSTRASSSSAPSSPTRRSPPPPRPLSRQRPCTASLTAP